MSVFISKYKASILFFTADPLSTHKRQRKLDWLEFKDFEVQILACGDIGRLGDNIDILKQNTLKTNMLFHWEFD